MFRTRGSGISSDMESTIVPQLLAEIDGVERVSLAVDGALVEWPRGDGSLTSEPLTIFDYPGRAVSSQPDYPAIVVAGAQP